MYYPKNRIVTNLYTRGGEYMFASSNKEYTGYYHKVYDGSIFTGKTPNDPQVESLIYINYQEELDIQPATPRTSKIALFIGDPDPLVTEGEWNGFDVFTYNLLSGGESDNDNPRQLPIPFYPKPTQDDYNLGEFQRYFVKKENQIVYIEVNLETYNNINDGNKNYLWQLYIPINISWQISGNRIDVSKTNRNMVALTEFNLRIRGFSKYLKDDYLKFYKYVSQDNLYTDGDELVTTDGKDYSGYYHINEKMGPMVGKVHTLTSHHRLIWKDEYKGKFKEKLKDIKPFQTKPTPRKKPSY